ncbi:MAG: single-stranded DNA-binding protein [Proteobacteria bacterium]|nr:single-stranded DNA-binding protein [Pseudomonadota bacterium]
MASVNRVTLIGRVGKDPELRYTADGTAVATFSLATSESWKDKSGTKHERTEWHDIHVWRKLAEIVGEYVRKGRMIYVEGKIESRGYDGKDGSKRRQFSIVANNVIMLPSGDKKTSETGSSDKKTGFKKEVNKAANISADEFFPEFDDDIEM